MNGTDGRPSAVPEAQLSDAGSGLAPTGEGWFVVNVRDTRWSTNAAFGAACGFESEGAWMQQFGVNLRALEPGQPACLYHSESQQEAFLVLSGACTLLVEGEERSLRQWDFFHCPAWTEHVVVGAGDGPCVVLMIGARTPDEVLHYPMSDLADRYGAGATEATSDPRVAYAPYERSLQARPPYWDQLPWA